MKPFKRQTNSFKRQVNKALSFFSSLKNKIFRKKKKFKPIDLDKKLVYSLSPQKIPNRQQLKYLKRFLNPREYLLIKLALLVILVNLVFLGVVFFKKHLSYYPVYGGEYVEGSVSYPKTTNPLYAIDREIGGDLSRLVYSSLFTYDKQGQLINDLVADYSIEEDKVYIIRIKEGVKWHDDSPVTVDDVIFTLEAIKNEDYHSPLRNSFLEVEIEKLDELSLKLSLPSPYAPFLNNLTFGILPKNLWGKTNPDAVILSELNLKPVGSGPYKFKSLNKNKEGVIKDYNLTVNTDYYGELPYIKNIKFEFFPNYPEAFHALSDRQIDGLSYLPISEQAGLKGFSSFAGEVNELIRPQVFGLYFNQEKNSSLTQAVRIALAKAIDKDELIESVFSGAYQREDGPILSSSYAYFPELFKYDFQPDQAREELESKLSKISITVIDANRNVLVAEKIKEYWENIGIEVEIKVVMPEEAIEIIKNRDFEVIFYGTEVGADPDIYIFWHSSQAKTGGLNIANYSNKSVDDLLTEARETTNQEQRVAKYWEIQSKITEDLPVVFLFSPSYTYLQSKRVKGFSGEVIITSADRFSTISDWYLKTKAKFNW
ncbi:MAG: ABC transporter substrate-binding protein [Patescibacteria group bacterium]